MRFAFLSAFLPTSVRKLTLAAATFGVLAASGALFSSASAQDLMLRDRGNSAPAASGGPGPIRTDLSKIPPFKSSFREPAVKGMPYYVEFRSRQALSYGHTFLVHGRLSGGRIVSGTVVGLHPAGEDPRNWVMGHFLPVQSETGPSDGDTEDQYVTARYRVNLNAAQYKTLVAHLKQKQTVSTSWHAVMNNCNNFVGEVARYMGLKAPMSSMSMPQEYITALKTINSGQNTAPDLGTQASTM